MFYQNLFSKICRFTKIFLVEICRFTKIFAAKKGLSFHINKEKAARISCENILAALYGSLKKLYFLS